MIKTLKNEKGITLIALVLTIIVMIIIASVSVYEGRKVITEAKVETLETNLLAIEAKAKGYAEEVDAQTWNLEESKKQTERDTKFNEYGMTPIDDDAELVNHIAGLKDHFNIQIGETYYAYKVTSIALGNMGLTDFVEEDDEYVVIYDSSDYKKMDVVYTHGISYSGERYYTLSELREVLGEQ